MLRISLLLDGPGRKYNKPKRENPCTQKEAVKKRLMTFDYLLRLKEERRKGAEGVRKGENSLRPSNSRTRKSFF